MNKHPVEDSDAGVEQIIAELHERGVKAGKDESARILAEARMKSGEILKDAESERARIIADGESEAERIKVAAKVEAEQMLAAFMASLPDIFAKRAARLLDEILASTFAANDSSKTITEFVSYLDGDKEGKLKAFFVAADPQTFLEGLLVMAVAFYSETNGLDHFTLDDNLKKTWARLMGDPRFNPGFTYEFRDGICGFSVSGKDGREIIVSPECVKHMAQAWAGEEFRDIYMTLQALPENAGGD